MEKVENFLGKMSESKVEFKIADATGKKENRQTIAMGTPSRESFAKDPHGAMDAAQSAFANFITQISEKASEMTKAHDLLLQEKAVINF